MKKNYFLRVFCLAVFTVILLFAGCSLAEQKKDEETGSGSLNIMTWNVHNLFDGKDDGYEYAEFLEASGWTAEKYMGRINTISQAIDSLDNKPDVILLQEVESLVVLEDLAAALSRGYSWSHFANNHGSAVGIGIISRLPLDEGRVHSITINGETTPRPVLETRVQTDNEEIVIFVCHWKSKIGGDEATESVRKASARVILRRIRELRENEPEIGIIIAGDLNENHDEFFRQKSNYVSALIPDDPYCALLTECIGADSDEIESLQKDFIVLSRNKPPEPVHFPQGTITFFSPWMRDLENGSYYYSYNWETIDHFLISGHFFNNTGWEYDTAMVVNFPPFANANGYPVPYNVKTGNGLSDHFPLLMILKNLSE